MLRLYRRHRASCPHRAETYRRCKCPIYVDGWLGGEYIRKALNLTSWDAASSLVNQWSAAREALFQPVIPSVREAIEKFTADAQARNLKPESVKKVTFALARFQTYCDRKGYTRLRQLEVDAVREFRNELSAHYPSAISAGKRFDVVRSFLRFCHQSGWNTLNPGAAVKPPRTTEAEVETFDPEDIERMLNAADQFNTRGKYGPGNRKRIRAMVLLLRYSGLRISDAAVLARASLQDDKLSLRTIKTGTNVWCPLPPVAVEALNDSPSDDARYFFWNGNCRSTSAVKVWERTLQRVFEVARIPDHKAFPHNFRHTFATDLLARGIPIEDVATLLGNSVRIVEKHYAHLGKVRQERLEARVRALWEGVA